MTDEPQSYYRGSEALERYPRETEVIVLIEEGGEILCSHPPNLPALPVAYLYPEDAQRGLEQAGHDKPCSFGKATMGELYDEFPAVILVEREGTMWHDVIVQP